MKDYKNSPGSPSDPLPFRPRDRPRVEREGGEEQDYESLRRELVRAVARTCPPWLADRSDDLVQTALMRIMEIKRRDEGNRWLSAFYLRKTAYSAVVDEIRRQRRRGEVPLEIETSDEREIARPMPQPGPDPEEQAEGRETGRAIHSCLGTLIRPRRLAVTLHLQGHNSKGVAELLGWTPKKAENLIYRGLADLRDCLRQRGMAR